MDTKIIAGGIFAVTTGISVGYYLHWRKKRKEAESTVILFSTACSLLSDEALQELDDAVAFWDIVNRD